MLILVAIVVFIVVFIVFKTVQEVESPYVV